MKESIRLVHIGLGPIGRVIAKMAADLPHLRSVGAVDLNPALLGQDLGTVTGGRPTGIRVHGDLDAALDGIEADVAVHCTGSRLGAVEGQLLELTERGLDVVSTCEELSWPWFHHPEEAERIDAAARTRGTRVLGTGVNPGFVMDLLPVVLAGVAKRVDGVSVKRAVDASSRRGPLQMKIGSGLSPEEFRERVQEKRLGHVGLTESVALVGAALGVKLSRITETIDPVVADKAIQTDAVSVRAGQACGLHQVAQGFVGERPFITLDLAMYLGHQKPGDTITLDSDPPISLAIDGGTSGDVATAGAALSALGRIQYGRPGLLSVVDLPAYTAWAPGVSLNRQPSVATALRPPWEVHDPVPN